MGSGNKAEMMIAICALVSSIAAVFMAWDQGRVMRSQEKADVWPMIQVTHETDTASTNSYRFHVQNAGVGPALIEDYLIRIPGRSDTTEFREMVNYFMPGEELGPATYADATLTARVLRQGAELDPIQAVWSDGEAVAAIMQARIDDFVAQRAAPAEVFICYCSILDECWVTSTLLSHPRPTEVNSCGEIKSVADRLYPNTQPVSQTEESIQ